MLKTIREFFTRANFRALIKRRYYDEALQNEITKVYATLLEHNGNTYITLNARNNNTQKQLEALAKRLGVVYDPNFDAYTKTNKEL